MPNLPWNFALEYSVVVLLFQLTFISVESLKLHFHSPNTSLSYEKQIITLNENEQLEIICTSEKGPVNFIYPDKDEEVPRWSKRTFSPTQMINYEITENNVKIFHADLRKNKTVYGDGGVYECRSPSRIFTLHVYINSNVSFFVENNIVPKPKLSINQYFATFSDRVISCIPTSKNYKLVVFLNGEETRFQRLYEGRFSETDFHTPGIYTCRLYENENIVAEKSFEAINETCLSTIPQITGYLLPHAIRNQPLSINCSVKNNFHRERMLEWILPVKTSTNRITTRIHEIFHPILMNCRTFVNELRFTEVTDEDTGEFKCEALSPDKPKKVSTPITLDIHNPGFTKCELSTTKELHEQVVGNSVELTASFDTYPVKPELTWFDPRGFRIIDQQNKFEIETIDRQTKLKIMNSNMSDDGFYRLSARISVPQSSSITFRLIMWENRLIRHLDNIKGYYIPGETAKVNCIISPNQHLKLTWAFEADPQSMPSSSIGDIGNMEFTSNNATVMWNVRSSGNITCRACVESSEECYWVQRQILMSDVPNGFGIIPSKTNVMIGDKLELICAASIYHFTDEIEWINSYGTLLEKSNRIKVQRSKTLFTFRSILTINEVEKSDEQLYTCRTFKKYDTMKRNPTHRTYALEVQPPKPPYIVTNLNGTQSIYSTGMTIDLWCYANGTLDPTVSWSKNNLPLIDMNQTQTICNFKFRNNNQELHIEKLGRECNGIYSCRGENRLNKSIEYNQEIIIRIPEVGKEGESKFFNVFTVFVIIIIIICVLSTAVAWTNQKILQRRLKKLCLENFEQGVAESLNPELTMDRQAEFLPYDPKYEFPKRNLNFGGKLGSGAFGIVVKAEAEGICKDELQTTVAVKIASKKADATSLKDLASELKIMVYLGKHVNVISLLGACTKNISRGELLVIVEYCCYGSLYDCLVEHKSSYIDQVNPTTGEIDSSIAPSISLIPSSLERSSLVVSTKCLLLWAAQVSRGMDYLSKRKVLHRDLAARNILLAQGNIVKICDFGLSKSLQEDDFYKVTSNFCLPAKWLAIESLDSGIFSTQSDVWSFGIVIWEFFTFAALPYSNIQTSSLCSMLKRGYRLEKPKHATQKIYEIMLQCWSANPNCRPTFQILSDQIISLMEGDEKTFLNILNKKNENDSKFKYLRNLKMDDISKAMSSIRFPFHVQSTVE